MKKQEDGDTKKEQQNQQKVLSVGGEAVAQFILS